MIRIILIIILAYANLSQAVTVNFNSPSYNASWTNLANGKQLAKQDPNSISYPSMLYSINPDLNSYPMPIRTSVVGEYNAAAVATNMTVTLDGLEVYGYLDNGVLKTGFLPRHILSGITTLAVRSATGVTTTRLLNSTSQLKIDRLRLRVAAFKNGAPATGEWGTSALIVDGIGSFELTNCALKATQSTFSVREFVRVRNLKSARVQNCYFTGAVAQTMFQAINTEKLYFALNEVAGLAYPGITGLAASMGVRHVTDEEGFARGLVSESVIESNYLHDFTYSNNKDANEDGIIAEAIDKVLIFNNVIERWSSTESTIRANTPGVDAAIDVSFRNPDAGGGKLIRIERNMIIDSLRIKCAVRARSSRRAG